MNAKSNQQPTRREIAIRFQRGVDFPLPHTCTIREFLISLPGFTDQYLDERVQTIFHNGKAIDDIDVTFLKDKDILALSAAMPGLAGAIFRKGGRHAPLRTQSGKNDKAQNETDSGTVTLKLFNMIATERGPELLAGRK